MKHRLVVEQNLKKKARTWVNKEKKRAQVVSGQVCILCM